MFQKNKIFYQLLFKLGLFGLLFLLDLSGIQAANSPSDTLATNPIREEVQRYIGYEDLLYRFTSLPYDMTMNTNVKGFHLDFSFLFLLLIPILFLSKKLPLVEKLPACLLLFLMLVISIPINYCNKASISVEQLGEHVEAQLNFGNPDIWSLRYLTLSITKIAGKLFQPIHHFFKNYTGSQDAITLPFILLTFLGSLWIFYRLTKNRSQALQGLLFFIAIYAFLWFFLAVGIVWYGILFFPIALALLFIGLQTAPKLVKITIYGIAAIWLINGLTYRLTNYLPYNEEYGKGLVDKTTLLYQSGVWSKVNYLNEFYPKYSEASQILNREDQSLIYMVNTMLPFFIKKNDRRVIKDGQLGKYATMSRQFPNKKQLAQAMEAYNIRYIVFGLKTYTIDKTPEQSLAKKYQAFLQFLENNEQLKLLVTDRTILNETGQKVEGMFGGKIQEFGSFALYELKEE